MRSGSSNKKFFSVGGLCSCSQRFGTIAKMSADKKAYDKILFSSEIIGNGGISAVRVTKQPIHGYRRMAARDLIGVVCQKNNDDAGKVWRTLNPVLMTMLTPFLVDIKFEMGRATKAQPALTLQGCFTLLMMLPGLHAKLIRVRVAHVLLGFVADDKQLVAEIRANKNNNELLNDVACETLTCEGEYPRKKYKKMPLLYITDADYDDAPTEGQNLSLVIYENEFNALFARWAREEEEAIAAANGGRVHGYCYVAWNPCFPSVCKIGCTTRTPEVRVRELSQTSVPEPFQLVASFPCWEPLKVEKRIHKHFAAARKYGRSNEFFDLRRAELIAYFALIAEEVGARGPSTPRAPALPSLRKEVVALRAQVAAQGLELQQQSAVILALQRRLDASGSDVPQQ